MPPRGAIFTRPRVSLTLLSLRIVVYVFLGVAKSIVGKLLCFGVGIVECLFNLLKYPFSPQRDFI